MKSGYNITNIINLDTTSVEREMLNSDFIITKRGVNRDAITYTGLQERLNDKILCIDIDDVEGCLKQNQENGPSTKISVDISLIDRKSLADLFSILAKLAIEHCYEVSIVYALAKYAPPSGEILSNNNVKPVSHFFSGWSNRPGMSVFSIVGLGYERDKAMGAIEFLESSEVCLYIPQSIEEDYFTDVITENSSLLEHFNKRYQLLYRLDSPIEAIYSLDAVIRANKNKYKVVLLPFGPKLFYALSLLTCIPHPEVSVWYVSGESGDRDSSQDREVSSLIGFKFCISNSSIEE
ncbi:transcription elongation factor GreB [Photobacterium leiognathi]|uniref:transcription elongation factor GreB n=1 Tax=Photobacterium leiognathi TaxID=553611 RepID=UPI0029813F88|nr:transcription elongation factor GreB [Photobacterium leiognathi]